jgi:hypothetical protein
LIFLDDLDPILKDALKEDDFLNNYTLEKKELYR